MDHLRRLAFAVFAAAALVLLFAPALARADACPAGNEGYECTPKVALTTGGTAKVPGSEPVPGGVWAWASGPTYAPCHVTLAASGASAFNACVVGYVNSLSSYAAEDRGYVVSGDGASVAITHAYCGPPKACTPSTTATYTYGAVCPGGSTAAAGGGEFPKCVSSALVCPQGTGEGAGGLCYPLVCPTATPEWFSLNSTTCRRPLECPWPQRRNGSACVCGTGTQIQFASGGEGGVGIAQPIEAVVNVASTSLLPMPSQLCLVDGSNTEGCAVYPEVASFDGTRTQFWGQSFTGQTCSGGTTAGSPQDVSDQSCPSGQVRGTVNGQSVCVKAGTTTETRPPVVTTSTVTNPDGSTSTTTTTTTEVVNCTAGACNTTTTINTSVVTRDPQGNPTGTTTTETSGTQPGTGDGEGWGDFCADRPDSIICKQSRFSGSCPAFTCDGDAVQCAIAKEQHQRNCQFWSEVSGTDAGVTTSVGVEALGGAPNGMLITGTVQELAALNTTARINAGSCPAPSSFASPLGTITVEWTVVCDAAGWFSWVIVMSALIVAARIVIGGL